MKDQFNYSREEFDKMRRRAEIRNRLRMEYDKKRLNPLLLAYDVDIYDPAASRLLVTQSNFFEILHKANRSYWTKNTILAVTPFAIFIYLIQTSTAKREKQIRSGQITAYDRIFGCFK